ncbi:MAG: pteridine reductase [Gammaproteobacteria bacterium]|nr:pteridine reductase [Gammaproteobacteria bacterium]
MDSKVALITGAGRRLGARIATTLHAHGLRVAVHFNRSSSAAQALVAQLNAGRAASAAAFAADLSDDAALRTLLAAVTQTFGRLDVLVNNASVFRATPIGATSSTDWDEILGTNLKAPYLLSELAVPFLKARRGCIINLTDVYADRPRPNYAMYCISKAGLVGLTRALARDLAPEIRVNAVSPGAILWSADASTTEQSAILARTPLARAGEALDIAMAVRYLVDAEYVTGQVLAVDGGRSIFD